MLEFKSDLAGSLDKLFDKIDNDGDGRIDGLEFLGGVALCCRGTFEEKAKFAFELYDFNLNAALSATEICMLMQSSVCGMLVLTGGTEDEEPDVEQFEQLAKDALSRADTDGSGQVTYDEFVEWARSNVQIMSTIEVLSRVTDEVTLSVEDEDSAEEEEDDKDAALLLSSSFGGEIILEDRSPLHEAVVTESNGLIEKIAESGNGAMGIQADRVRKACAYVSADVGVAGAIACQEDNDGPPTYLELEWIYGYNSRMRSNLSYLKSEDDTDKDGCTRCAAPFFFHFCVSFVVSLLCTYPLCSPSAQVCVPRGHGSCAIP